MEMSCVERKCYSSFIDQIKNKKPITITNPNMTRYLMTLDDAVDLVFFAFDNGSAGDLFVHKVRLQL